MSRNWGYSALEGISKDLIQVIKGKVPSKSNQNRIGKGKFFKSQEVSNYETSFLWQCDKYRNKRINTWFEFYIDVYYSANRQDLDNSFKVILDCLQAAKAITNDNKCVRIISEKRFSKDTRIENAIIKRE